MAVQLLSSQNDAVIVSDGHVIYGDIPRAAFSPSIFTPFTEMGKYTFKIKVKEDAIA